MQHSSRIIQQAANEFIVEFDQQRYAHEMTENQVFLHEGNRYKIFRAYPGVEMPGCYTFLVIAEKL